MSARTQIGERYLDGFRRADHGQILSCLDKWIVWKIHGHKTISGKTSFASEVEGRGDADRMPSSPAATAA